GLDPDFYVTRERGADEIFPWEIIDSGVRRDFLCREYQAALAHARSRRCFDGCVDCGVCRGK
ncbi:MAG: radical SAM protein, partial [Trichloromonas sp.]|nr:radical SAM protein [Trichloromonas sp.]